MSAGIYPGRKGQIAHRQQPDRQPHQQQEQQGGVFFVEFGLRNAECGFGATRHRQPPATSSNQQPATNHQQPQPRPGKAQANQRKPLPEKRPERDTQGQSNAKPGERIPAPPGSRPGKQRQHTRQRQKKQGDGQ
jgi:hypothetical protein